MQSLYLLIPIVLIVVAVGVTLFFWAVNNGQYDDLDKESQRIFFDDEEIDQPLKKINKDSDANKNGNEMINPNNQNEKEN